ncbi:MAG: flippase-like domain-containing protein [Actinomycetota bacterium]|nr:flippase-like domain-containing protein [Actinomycetota bacterium]
MIASDHSSAHLPLPALELRSLARRAAAPALVAAAAVAVVVLAGGRVRAFTDAIQRGLGVSPGWAAVGTGFEFVSLAGYVALLSLVVGRATPRVGSRESAQITLAGIAATRLLPTAGAGGAALTLWTLRRAGLKPVAATRTLLAFMVVLYSVFLVAIVLCGAALALGLVPSRGPAALSAVSAIAATCAITLALALAFGRGVRAEIDAGVDADARGRASRLRSGARLVANAVRDAVRLVRLGDPRLAGAVAYWVFDAAVLWAMLHAFDSPPALPVVALAYCVGQVANTLPLPGSVSTGIAGVLVAFAVPIGLALPAVLAYRAVSVWLPSPVALAAVPGLRTTVARWGREDAAQLVQE